MLPSLALPIGGGQQFVEGTPRDPGHDLALRCWEREFRNGARNGRVHRLHGVPHTADGVSEPAVENTETQAEQLAFLRIHTYKYESLSSRFLSGKLHRPHRRHHELHMPHLLDVLQRIRSTAIPSVAHSG